MTYVIILGGNAWKRFILLVVLLVTCSLVPSSTAFQSLSSTYGVRHDTSSIALLRRTTPILYNQQQSSSLFDDDTLLSLFDDDSCQLWFPLELLNDDEKSTEQASTTRRQLEQESLQFMAQLVKNRLIRTSEIQAMDTTKESQTMALARGRFVDLCGLALGEERLETLFSTDNEAATEDSRVVMGAIMALQSLLILGMQFGVTKTREQMDRSVSHMREPDDDDAAASAADLMSWDSSSTRRLKLKNNGLAGTQLLAELNRKRNPRGAVDLLVAIGAWQSQEDMSLLRSGFSLRFSQNDLNIAEEASSSLFDIDATLGIRKDMRDQKTYTIDGKSASEIDDALGVEVIAADDGSERYRYWIHIADADRWAPRGSDLFEIGRQRATSLYVPSSAISMFPETAAKGKMSLSPRVDREALSLGVELNEDGSVDESSLVMTLSTVRVSYGLTYDDVDEMLEDGVAFADEWPIGVLFDGALKRRAFRMSKGSTEAVVPVQIPQFKISTFPNAASKDNTGIAVTVEVSHNGGRNQSSTVEYDEQSSDTTSHDLPVSSASTLVTEMMILAGEAIGKWKQQQDSEVSRTERLPFKNEIQLPFRCQPKPDYRGREREQKIMMDLQENNVGGGYCHAWYSRRFLNPVVILEDARCHYGLGLDSYVQWTSPIRRYTDLQVHTVVKRYLRRDRVIELLKSGASLPAELTSSDVGGMTIDGAQINIEELDGDIDFSDRSKWMIASRRISRESSRYWMLEYIHRLRQADPQRSFDAMILGCINPSRRQYAIYIHELGFESRYISPYGNLLAGEKLKVAIGKVIPHNGLLSWLRSDW